MTQWNLKSPTSRLFAITVFLLVVFASRVQFLTDMPLHIDEARTGMRIMGTPAEIVAWQPPDWPPLHNLLLAGWSVLAGEYPFSLRVFSSFFSILSVAIAYKMAFQLTRDRRMAFGTMVIYAGLGMSIYLGIFMRGYAQVMALFPLAIWLTVRYFEFHKIRQAVALAITLGFIFTSTYTSVISFIFLGFLSILLYPRQLWRWFIVGLFASPFALFELLRKWDYWFNRFVEGEPFWRPTYYVSDTYLTHYHEYVGQLPLIWLSLVVIALVLWFIKGRQHWRIVFWVIFAGLLAPLITHTLVESGVFVLMTARYSWWVVIILSIGLALGLRYLPGIIWFGAMALITGLMVTLPLTAIYYPYEPVITTYYEDNLEWLQQKIQPGDVLMFDPKFCDGNCLDKEELAYYWNVYLGDKLTLVDSPEGHRRVWLWRGIGHSRDLLKELSETHVPSIFYGHPQSLLELYVAPPDPEGILFDNGMRFHGFDIVYADGGYDSPPYNLRELTSVEIHLWWSSDRPIDKDYQISLQIHTTATREELLLLQSDGAPNLVHLKPNDFEELPPTTLEWEPGQLYVGSRILDIPDITEGIPSELILIIYSLPDGERVSAGDKTDDQDLLPLAEFVIWGWG